MTSTPTFTNHAKKRLWTEEECRTMLNAALLYLAEKNGGRLDIPTDEMLKVCGAIGSKGVAMALSDDDKVLTITAMSAVS
jgi:hypothetical protein